MNKLVIIAGFALYLVVFVRTSPSAETMVDLLVSTENHTDYKCPYLRETMLNEAQFDFLKDCPGSTKLRGNSDMLCVLFYNNFLKLCNYSMRNHFDLKILLNDSTVKASLSQKNIDGVCDSLKTTEPFNQSLGPTLAHINRFMAHSCPLLCLNAIDDSTYPICTMSAMMSSFAKQLSNVAAQAAAVHKQDVKNDNPVKTPPEAAAPPKINETKPAETGKSGAKKDAVVKLLQAPPQQEQKVAESPAKKEPDEPKPKPKPDVEKSAPVKPAKTVQETPKEVVPKVQSQKPEVKGKKAEDVPKVADVPQVPNESSNDKQEEKAKAEDNEKVEVINENHDSQYDVDDDIAILKTEEDEISAKAGKPKPKETNEDAVPANPNNQMDEEDSFFFVYFMMVCAVFILGYIGYHNKQKVLALVIEGRRGRRGSRRSGRPNSANYHKLDSNLEEAVTSSVHKNTTNIIY